jgi:hypothetical protein
LNDWLAAQSVIAFSASVHVTHQLDFPSRQVLPNHSPKGH